MTKTSGATIAEAICATAQIAGKSLEVVRHFPLSNPFPSHQPTNPLVFGHNFTLPSTSVTITTPSSDLTTQLSVYKDHATLSGQPVSRYFCRTCGNPIKSETPVYPGMTIVKMGMFKETPVPEWESFVKDRQGFERKAGTVEGCVLYRDKSRGDIWVG